MAAYRWDAKDAAALAEFRAHPADLGFPRTLPQHFDLGRRLGQGGFGTVRLATRKVGEHAGQDFACKTVAKVIEAEVPLARQLQHMDRIQREVAVLRQLQGNLNIVRLEGVYEDDAAVHILMELCTGGDLWRATGTPNYSEGRVRTYMRSVLRTIAQCHAHNILHRDVKPGNFLLLNDAPDAPLKAIDFGNAVAYDPQELPRSDLGFDGTPWYMAPEVLSSAVVPASDVWSAGVMAYQMLTGRLPFDDRANPQAPALSLVWKSILAGQPAFHARHWGGLSDAAQDFVRSLLVKSPEQRPSARAALQHPWLEGSLTQPDAPLSKQVVARLQRFGRGSLLQRTIMDMMAYELLQHHIHALSSKRGREGAGPPEGRLPEAHPPSIPEEGGGEAAAAVPMEQDAPDPAAAADTSWAAWLAAVPEGGSSPPPARRGSKTVSFACPTDIGDSDDGDWDADMEHEMSVGGSEGLSPRRTASLDAPSTGGAADKPARPRLRVSLDQAQEADIQGPSPSLKASLQRIQKSHSYGALLHLMQGGSRRARHSYRASQSGADARAAQRKADRLALDTSRHDSQRYEAYLQELRSPGREARRSGSGSGSGCASSQLDEPVEARGALARPPDLSSKSMAVPGRVAPELAAPVRAGLSGAKVVGSAPQLRDLLPAGSEEAEAGPSGGGSRGEEATSHGQPLYKQLMAEQGIELPPSQPPPQQQSEERRGGLGEEKLEGLVSLLGDASRSPREVVSMINALRLSGDRPVSMEQLSEGLERLGFQLSTKEVEMLLSRAAPGQDALGIHTFLASQLDWHEFQSAHRNCWLDCLRGTFQGLDPDNTGRIGTKELVRALQGKLPEGEVDRAVEDAMMEACADAAGIDFNQFCEVVEANSAAATDHQHLDVYDARAGSHHGGMEFSRACAEAEHPPPPTSKQL